jgi:glyoxylase-like metal-dependent hydrolase (beta-lactamase superfamily II)
VRNRRDVLRGIAGGVAAAALPSSAFALDVLTDDAVRDLRILSGAGGNIVVLTTTDGQIVVDSGNAESSGEVVKALRTLGVPDGKVAVLVNTHWHRDQTGANEALGAAGTTIVAHEKTRQRLSAGWYVPSEDRYEKPLAPAGRPTKAFYDTGALQVGEKRVEFGYLIEAHTDGDLYVRFPDVNIVAVGDVVSPERDPVLDWFGGGWLGGRVDALKKLLSLGDADTRYVPSFGPLIDRAAVQAEHDLMLAIFDRMVVNLRLGQTADDMLKAGLLGGLPRTFTDPAKFLYDAHKGFWAHHNKLMHDIV